MAKECSVSVRPRLRSMERKSLPEEEVVSGCSYLPFGTRTFRLSSYCLVNISMTFVH
jgi:hypothetical protein